MNISVNKDIITVSRGNKSTYFNHCGYPYDDGKEFRLDFRLFNNSCDLFFNIRRLFDYITHLTLYSNNKKVTDIRVAKDIEEFKSELLSSLIDFHNKQKENEALDKP